MLESKNPYDYDLYLRKSRKDVEFNANETMEKTLERHEKQLQEYATRLLGGPIPEENIFREIVSGDTIDDRPQMQEILKRIEEKNRKGVFVMEIERLARGNTIDQGIIAQAFHYSNTLIITPTKIFDLNNEFDEGYFEDGLYQARKYLLYTKKILNRGRMQSVKEGKFVGSVTPYGYDKLKIENEKGYKLVPNEDAENVKLIFKLFLEDNLGTTSLAHYLNNYNIKSKTNSMWTPAMVRNILINPVYCGKLTWNRRRQVKKLVNGTLVSTCPISHDYLLTNGLHKPIIDEEYWNRVQNNLKSNSIKKVPNKFELKNPIAGLVKCKKCKRNMVRRPYSNRNKDTLICRTSGCENISSELKLVEDKVLKLLETKLKKYKFYVSNYEIEYTKQAKDKTIILNLLDKDIKKLEIQYSKACELLEVGVYTIEIYKKRTDYLQSQIQSKNEQKKELEDELMQNKFEKYAKAIPQIEKCIKLYHKTDSIEDKNELLSSIIDYITYEKNANGRWDKEAINKFEIELYLKI